MQLTARSAAAGHIWKLASTDGVQDFPYAHLQQYLCALLLVYLNPKGYWVFTQILQGRGEQSMNALRQTTRLLRHRPVQQVRAAHQDSTDTDTVYRVDGEIGVASGAPENIYKRQVQLGPKC